METLQRTANRGSLATGYDIENSLKLEADNTEYLIKTNDAGTNRKTFTVSMWFKRTELANDYMQLWQGGVNGEATRMGFYGGTPKEAIWVDVGGGSGNTGADYRSYSVQVARDTSAWYHIVLAVDTTQSTAADRLKVWLNGDEITTWTNQAIPAQDFQCSLEANINMTWGAYNSTYYKMCGYIAECHYLDGVAKVQTDFGEYDEDSGIWKPKAYTGTYGGNGCYLNFDDSSNLGADSSGNGNNFTLNNITSADQATDTPTNNFCTMNMLDRTNGNSKNQEGATKVTTDGGSGWCSMVATMGVTKGKWYWETQRSGGSSDSNDVVTGIVGSEDAYIPYSSAAQYYIGNVATSSSIGFYTTGSPNVKNGDGGSLSNSPGDIIMIGLDMDNSKIYFGINGTWDALGTGGSSLHADFDGEFVLPAVAVYQGKQIKINFGGYASYTISSAASDADGYGTFEYAPPSGYYALCTKNLAEYG